VWILCNRPITDQILEEECEYNRTVQSAVYRLLRKPMTNLGEECCTTLILSLAYPLNEFG
jgi:hypothetical protein